MSDLHLEMAPLQFVGNKNHQILLLSGDIMVADFFRTGRMTDAKGFVDRFDRFNHFIHNECNKYKKVYYIAGNHEHYHGIITQSHDILRKAVEGTNITFLDNETVELDDKHVLFGGTMWTNCNQRSPDAMNYIQRRMNDYYVIKYPEGDTFTPEDSVNLHEKTLAALTEALTKHPDKKFVVMTHHTPSFKSVAAKYMGDVLMNYGYHSELDYFIKQHPNIVVWTHGHTHDSFDYKIGNTRVLCNPRGYSNAHSPDKQENERFDKNFTFEV